MKYLTDYQRWLKKTESNRELYRELMSIADDSAAIEDRFYRSLAFGTGGLRGVLGAGTNRMNIYTVAQATQGLANYILMQQGDNRSVAIAYDSRINSRLFAETAACVLVGNGIMTHLFPRLAPTPLLSFAVRELGCVAGICITASHNPAKYNGYKVYGGDGCQITVEAAKTIQQAIDSVDVLDGAKMVSIETARKSGLLRDVEEWVFDRFIDDVYGQKMPEAVSPEELRVVYTPLNGTGKECVLRILNRIGISDVTLVPSQELPDGNFPTCPYPNPEEREALSEGLKLCDQVKPDLLLATDPDCDRVGTAISENGDYRLLSGNEMGILLLDYICKARLEAGTMPKSPVAVTTIVSTDMADAVAKKYGVELRRTLTGFKFIGEQIGLLEKANEKERYIFGFEESYGYLSGPHVRDKDAVNASMLICQMARYYKSLGISLGQAMDALFEEYGYYLNRLLSFSFAGSDGMEKMRNIMRGLRKEPPKSIGTYEVSTVRDYLLPQGELPRADVLEFVLEGKGKLTVRPSGTEPKLKAYLFSHGLSNEEAGELLNTLEIDVRHRLEK